MDFHLSKSCACPLPVNFALAVILSTAYAAFGQAQSQRCPGIMVQENFDWNGNDVLTDSFDSSDPYKSDYGHYNPNVYSGNYGDIVCNGSITNSIPSAGSANIFGHVAVGSDQTAAVGSSGGIGSHAWQAGNPGTIEPNGLEGQVWYSHDSHFTPPQIGLPYSSGFVPEGAMDIVTPNYNIISNYIAGSSNYPNPVPWSGVTTNIIGTNTVPSYPGDMPEIVTNTAPTGTFGCTNYPAAGTYAGGVSTNFAFVTGRPYPTNCYFGTPAPHTNSNGTVTWSYFQIVGYSFNQIASYSYPIFTYNYATYSTNTFYWTNHYDHVLRSGDYYYLGNLSGGTIVLGTCRLVLPNGLHMTGADSIVIARTSGGFSHGSLSLYAGSTSCAISGNGIINLPGYARDCVVYCTTNVSSVRFDGNGEFIGVIIAPQANLVMNGGGHADNDVEGALMVKSVLLNAHYKFHYDESLAASDVLRPFIYALTPAAVLGSPVVAGGLFGFGISGLPGSAYVIDASSDLINWTALQTNPAPFLFTDTAATDYSRRFYRARWVQ